MRLIDAYGSYTLNANDNTGCSLGFGGGIISFSDKYGHIVAEFDADDAPAVDPVKHGRWLEKRIVRYNGTKPYTQFAHECSECKWLNKRKKGWHTKFCPNCGAKMDGGGEDVH
jgi:hypothetical protein